MTGTIHELFAGHLRSIVGGLTIEQMLHDRNALTSEVRDSLAGDMQRLGLTVDSLQIQEIEDLDSDYIRNLGRPNAAAVSAAARIAEAAKDQEVADEVSPGPCGLKWRCVACVPAPGSEDLKT